MAEEDENSDPAQGPAASWDAARRFAGLIGDPPRFIRATIHFLRRDVEENGNELSFQAQSCLLPLLRSKQFQAGLYYTAQTCFPERLHGKSLNTPRKLSTLYRPDEFIAILSVMYLYRRMRKGCEKESFQQFSKNVSHNWLLCGAIGRAIEKIGFANGLLYGALPHLAQCLFLGVDRKGFKGYRTKTRQSKLLFFLEEEEERWKCNCLQVAVLIAQCLGLGKQYHDPFMLGLPNTDLAALQNNDELYGAQLLLVWLSALKETGNAPDMPHRGEFYPFASEMEFLKGVTEKIINAPHEELFLHKSEKDLSPQLTPELFHDDGTKEEVDPSSSAATTLSELPEEIRNDFPEDLNLDLDIDQALS
ncbi:hypothetical protein MRY87_00795 [bacterium]|nr:hypothetical protein [bacterium]